MACTETDIIMLGVRFAIVLALMLTVIGCNDYIIKEFRKWNHKTEDMELIYSNLVPENKEAFIGEVERISRKLGIDPNWLMGVMYIETAGKFTASIKNPITGATGLIQFMPATAKGLGTTVEELALMSNVEQLEYVYKYLYPYRRKINRFIDCYLAVFFPAAMDKPLEYVIQTKSLSAGLIARQNPLFDLDRNGQITVYEIETGLLGKINSQYHPILKKKA